MRTISTKKSKGTTFDCYLRVQIFVHCKKSKISRNFMKLKEKERIKGLLKVLYMMKTLGD